MFYYAKGMATLLVHSERTCPNNSTMFNCTIDRFHSRDEKLSNRRYAAILVDQKCKQTRLRALYEDGILLDSRLWKQKHAR